MLVLLTCPSCQQPLRAPADRGDLTLICPGCQAQWPWSPPPPEQQRAEFERAVEADKNNPLPLLSYADWLKEQGEAEKARENRWVGQVLRRLYHILPNEVDRLCPHADWVGKDQGLPPPDPARQPLVLTCPTCSKPRKVTPGSQGTVVLCLECGTRWPPEEREEIQKLVEANPGSPLLHRLYAGWLERHGSEPEARKERWLESLAAEPYNPDPRSEFAGWLRGQGDEQGARQHEWMAGILRGRIRLGLVFTRQGILPQASKAWEGLRKQTRDYWLQATGSVFEDHPELLFIVASYKTPPQLGLRRENGSRFVHEGRSPICYWRRNHGSKCRVLVL